MNREEEIHAVLAMLNNHALALFEVGKPVVDSVRRLV